MAGQDDWWSDQPLATAADAKTFGQGAKSNSSESLEGQKSRDEARNRLDQIERAQAQLDRVHTLYDQNLRGSGPVKSLLEYLPTQKNAQFDSAVAGLRTLFRPLQRTPGEGQTTDYESKLAVRNLPDRFSFDGSNEESLGNLQTFLDTSRTAYSRRLGLPPAPPSTRRKRPANGWSIRKVR